MEENRYNNAIYGSWMWIQTVVPKTDERNSGTMVYKDCLRRRGRSLPTDQSLIKYPTGTIPGSSMVYCLKFCLRKHSAKLLLNSRQTVPPLWLQSNFIPAPN